MTDSKDILTELLDAQRCVNEIPAPDDLPQRAHDEIKRLRARLAEAEEAERLLRQVCEFTAGRYVSDNSLAALREFQSREIADIAISIEMAFGRLLKDRAALEESRRG